MNNVVSIYPSKTDYFLFYEVVGEDNRAVWGGDDPEEALDWLDLTSRSRLMISAWDSDDMEAHLVGRALDVTLLVQACRGGRG